MQGAISDSSILIHLAGIGRLELLKEFFGKIFIIPAVWNVEEGKERPGAREVKEAHEYGWIEVIAPTNESVIKFTEDLGRIAENVAFLNLLFGNRDK